MKSRILIVIALGVILSCIMANLPLLQASPASDLQAAIEHLNIKAVTKAVDELTAQNNETAFNYLIAYTNRVQDNPVDSQIYWLVLQGIARMSDKEVVQKVADLIIRYENKPLGQDLLCAMKANRSSSVIPVLSAILDKTGYNMQTEALHQLGTIYSQDAIAAIIDFLRPIKSEDKDKRDIVKAATNALKEITGIDRGTYPEAWVQWWEDNKDKDISQLIHPKAMNLGSIEKITDYRDTKAIQTLDKDKIIVVRNDGDDPYIAQAGGKGFDGNFDHIQNVLDRLGIPYTLVGKSELEKDSFDWDGKWAIIFNCMFFGDHCVNPEHLKLPQTNIKTGVRTVQCPGMDNNHLIKSFKLSEKAIKRIKEFVETGGYLFTEDLNIEEIIERAFRGYITHTKYLPDQTVTILPAVGAGLHPYLKYVFEAPPDAGGAANADILDEPGATKSAKAGEFRANAKWQIDDDSPDLKILNKDKVTVLITSPDLAKKDKNEGAVAVTFSPSDQIYNVSSASKGPSYAPGGRVLHVMSHFGKQRSKLDEFSLQNLIFNFLEEVAERHPKAALGMNQANGR